MQAACTEQDLVGRFGGEEFLFVLRNCDPRTLVSRANGIRKSISHIPVITSSGPLRVSISAGAVNIGVDDRTSSRDQVLQRADLLLYQAKREGRNRVISDHNPTTLFSGNNVVQAPLLKQLCCG